MEKLAIGTKSIRLDIEWETIYHQDPRYLVQMEKRSLLRWSE